MQEFYKGVGARQSINEESIITAFCVSSAESSPIRRLHRARRHRDVFAAFAGMAFKKQHDIALKAGETFEARDPFGHQVAVRQPGRRPRPSARIASSLSVGLEAFRDGKRVGILASEKRTYLDARASSSSSPRRKSASSRRRSRIRISCSRASPAATIAPSCASRSTRSSCGSGSAAFIMMIGGLVVMWPQAQRVPSDGLHGGDEARGRGPELAGAV